MRAVLDPNVLVAALLSRSGAPAQILSRWLAGAFELVVSETLLAELESALAYPKLHPHITPGEAAEFLSLLRNGAILAPDPPARTRRSTEPADDYLPALAESEHAVLVSGDQHLLARKDDLPIRPARAFLKALDAGLARPGS